MKLRTILFLAVCVLALAIPALAADINGQWIATFDTQVGQQSYTFTFKVDGEKLTGTAKSANGEYPIEGGVVKGDEISFVENMQYQGQPVKMSYTGKVSGDEIKFTRDVAGIAKEEFVAKRVKQ